MREHLRSLPAQRNDSLQYESDGDEYVVCTWSALLERFVCARVSLTSVACKQSCRLPQSWNPFEEWSGCSETSGILGTPLLPYDVDPLLLPITFTFFQFFTLLLNQLHPLSPKFPKKNKTTTAGAKSLVCTCDMERR